LISRSAARKSVLATAMVVMANTAINEVTRILQTNSGILFSDIPGARCLKIVMMSVTATQRIEISVNVIIWAQMSDPFVGSNCDSESGV
jgi:hypothetical protein